MSLQREPDNTKNLVDNSYLAKMNNGQHVYAMHKAKWQVYASQLCPAKNILTLSQTKSKGHAIFWMNVTTQQQVQFGNNIKEKLQRRVGPEYK